MVGFLLLLCHWSIAIIRQVLDSYLPSTIIGIHWVLIHYQDATGMCVCYPTVLGRAYNAFQWDWWCVLARSRWVLACSTSYLPTMNMYRRPTETYLVKGFTHGGMKSDLVSPLVLVMGWNSSEEIKLLPLSVSASVLNSFIKSIPTPTLLLLPFWELTWVPPNLTSGEDWDDECSLSPSETESRVELLTLGLLLVLVAGCWSGNTAKRIRYPRSGATHHYRLSTSCISFLYNVVNFSYHCYELPIIPRVLIDWYSKDSVYVCIFTCILSSSVLGRLVQAEVFHLDDGWSPMWHFITLWQLIGSW